MLEQVVDGLPVLLVHTDPDTPPGGGANTAGLRARCAWAGRGPGQVEICLDDLSIKVISL
jgi:hypothetical protein